MKIKHPTIKGLEQEVPDEDAPEWVAAGWIAPKARAKK